MSGELLLGWIGEWNVSESEYESEPGSGSGSGIILKLGCRQIGNVVYAEIYHLIPFFQTKYGRGRENAI